MNQLPDRLRDLRREAGTRRATAPAPAPAPAPSASASASASADLRRLLQLRVRHGDTRGIPASTDREVPGEEIVPGLHYTEEWMDWPAPPASIDARFARVGEPVARAHLLHFDTETTGLAGGTGTRAFMIGAADWIDSRLRLRQLTITSMAAETAMLRTFAGWLHAQSVLVSYNGKSYDAPLLATRYRLARLPNPLAGLRHLDLLHPVRRHWKGTWANCRLATAEHRLLGVVREDDLPGAEAPAAWLHYLRGGSAVNLRRVMQHNAQDLKSLAGILTYLAGMDACARYQATVSTALSRGDGLSCAACGAGACAHHNVGISTPAGAAQSPPAPSPSRAEGLLDHPRRSAGGGQRLPNHAWTVTRSYRRLEAQE